MNDAKVNGLPAEEQAMILDVTAKAVAMQRGAVQDKEAGMIAEPKAAGREVNTDVDAAAFQT